MLLLLPCYRNTECSNKWPQITKLVIGKAFSSHPGSWTGFITTIHHHPRTKRNIQREKTRPGKENRLFLNLVGISSFNQSPRIWFCVPYKCGHHNCHLKHLPHLCPPWGGNGTWADWPANVTSANVHLVSTEGCCYLCLQISLQWKGKGASPGHLGDAGQQSSCRFAELKLRLKWPKSVGKADEGQHPEDPPWSTGKGIYLSAARMMLEKMEINIFCRALTL